ncbi:MAG: hypothetical protein Q4A16_09960 [Lautropia sp.]|nr:hypothetical protein [Lautropia sp.]
MANDTVQETNARPDAGAVTDTDVAAEVNRTEPIATAPISPAGISTQLLSTMLDHIVGTGSTVAKQAVSLSGEAVATSTEPDIMVPQAPAREYLGSSQQSLNGYTPATGEYTYRASVLPVSGGGTAARVPSHIALNINPGSSQLELGSSINVATGSQGMGQGIDLPAADNTPLPNDELQKTGHVIRQWGSGTNVAQLILRTDDAPNYAKLCWNIAVNDVKRLQCYRWAVPSGWKHGDALNFIGVEVEEDVGPAAGTKVYWNSNN